MMKKSIFILTILIISICHAHAFDLDMTVDDEIRKNYNSSKLINDTGTVDEALPDLPSIPDLEDVQHERAVKNPASPPRKDLPFPGNVKISKGTSIDVLNSTKVSDWLTKGSTVKFYTKEPIIKRKYTIPANTVFYGEVIETHSPRISCNGGLVVIRVRKMNYKGHIVPVNAYITRADDRMIFLNNIKGRRTYLKTVWQKGNWGRTLFSRMLTMTVNLGGDGATLLLSPFPFAYGTICLGLNTLVSPVTAFFSKGGHVSIPSGSRFRIKLLDDIYVN